MNIYEKKHIEGNALFIKHQRAIDSIHSAVQREVPYLVHEFNLSAEEKDALIAFIDDRATLFRYLRKNNFSLPTTLSLLLDTIRWRIMADIDTIRIPFVADDFLSKPLVYFHKTDKVGRPVLVVDLAYLPQTPMNIETTTEFLTPIVIFVLETARLLLWDISQERTRQKVENPIILDTVVLIEFKNASGLPTDISLLKSLVTLLRRYPGMTGTVNLLNFGWMYQGLWQMCKLVLSSEAKAKVNFPKTKDLTSLIDSESIVASLDGKDEYQWSLSTDIYFTKYRPALPPTSPSPSISRRSSSSSIYFDTHSDLHHLAQLDMTPTASDKLTRPPSSFSLYNTPLLSPVASHTSLTNVAKAYSSLSLQSKLRDGVSPRFRTTIKQLGDLLTTTTTASHGTLQQQGVSPLALSAKLTAINTSTPPDASRPRRRGFDILRLFLRFETTVRQFTLRVLKKTLQYRSTLYWILACVLLRNGVQEVLQQTLLMMMELTVSPSSSSLLRLTVGQMTL